jgi:hypothetical protein
MARIARADIWRLNMKIKTNIRAGQGGASGGRQNGGTSTDSTSTGGGSKTVGSVVTYYNPAAAVSRCVGI